MTALHNLDAWLQAHTTQLAIASIAFQLGAFLQWWCSREQARR